MLTDRVDVESGAMLQTCVRCFFIAMDELRSYKRALPESKLVGFDRVTDGVPSWNTSLTSEVAIRFRNDHERKRTSVRIGRFGCGRMRRSVGGAVVPGDSERARNIRHNFGHLMLHWVGRESTGSIGVLGADRKSFGHVKPELELYFTDVGMPLAKLFCSDSRSSCSSRPGSGASEGCQIFGLFR